MANEEYLVRLSMLQEEAKRREEQLQIVNQQISEFEGLVLGIENLAGEKREVLAGLGKGVFFKCEVKDTELFVNIGSGVVLKKSGKETIEIIRKQISQLESMKESLVDEIENITKQLHFLVTEARKAEK